MDRQEAAVHRMALELPEVAKGLMDTRAGIQVLR